MVSLDSYVLAPKEEKNLETALSIAADDDLRRFCFGLDQSLCVTAMIHIAKDETFDERLWALMVRIAAYRVAEYEFRPTAHDSLRTWSFFQTLLLWLDTPEERVWFARKFLQTRNLREEQFTYLFDGFFRGHK